MSPAMARQLRQFREGLSVHVIHRGNNRQTIFSDDQDCEWFLTLLRHAFDEHRVAIHGFVLMKNHHHLQVTPADKDSLPEAMQQLGINYVRYFNRKHGRVGHLFSARRQAAEYQLTATEQRVRGLEDHIARDVRASWNRARTSFEAIAATQQLLNQANLALDLAQGRYNLGLSSIVELTQAQLGQTSAEVQNLNAKYEYQEAYAALQYTLGLLH